MARLKATFLREGQHPSEVMISVMTSNGSSETVIVDEETFKDGSFEIGHPVASDEKRYLVELPRETLTGQWRLWVSRNELVERVPA